MKGNRQHSKELAISLYLLTKMTLSRFENFRQMLLNVQWFSRGRHLSDKHLPIFKMRHPGEKSDSFL